VSRKTPKSSEDPFASIPPQESFDAFPSLSAFPEQEIAFLTGKGSPPEPPAQTPQLQPVVKSRVKPVSKPASQEACQAATKPVDQPDSRSDSLPINQTATTSATPSTGQPDSASDDVADSQPAAPKAMPSADLTASRSAGQPESPSKGQTTGQTVLPDRDLTLSLSQDQTKDLTGSLTLGRPLVADRLNANQRQVLDLLLAAKPYIVKFRDIADALGMREASVRTILRRLAGLSFLSFKKARDGNIQGVSVAFNQQVIEQYQKDQSLGQTKSPTGSHAVSQTIPVIAGQRESLTQNLSQDQPDSQTASRKDNPTASFTIEKKEHLSLENVFGWDDAFLELLWPHVYEAGFRLEQIRQAVEARTRLGKEIDRERIALSLDRADWELEATGMLVELATQEKVRNVGSYIFTALARWGVLRAHPDYVSREEQAAADAAGELARRREAAQALEAARFEQFVASLSKEEAERIMAGFPGGSREAWLKNYWRKHVREA